MSDLLGFDYTTGTIRWQAIAGANEIETVVQSGGATGGDYTLNYEHPAVTVGPINYNDNIATIQTAYDAAFGATNSLVSGTDATSFTVEFLVTYALTGVDYRDLTNGLTGGDSPTVTVTSTQRGRPDQIAPLLVLQDTAANSLLSLIPPSSSNPGTAGLSVLFDFTTAEVTLGSVIGGNGWGLRLNGESPNAAHNAYVSLGVIAPDDAGVGGVVGLVLNSTDFAGEIFLTYNATTSQVAVIAQAGQTDPLLDLQDGFMQVNNISDPAAPADNAARIYVRNNGGKDELVCRFATGAIQRLAIEP